MGWASIHAAPRGPTTLTYTVDLCDAVTSAIRTTNFLTWSGSITCDDVQHYVRMAMDAWTYNAMIDFVQVDANADIHISAGASEGLAHANFATLDVVVGHDSCWYDDRALCHAVYQNNVLVQVLIFVTWAIGIASALFFAFRPPRGYEGASRVLAWTFAVAPPIYYFGAILPCIMCYDLVTVLMHEVGHVIGFRHVDDPTLAHRCGCDNPVPCNASDDGVMRSIIKHRDNACLDRVDVDGARYMYGPRTACDDPILCYDVQPASYAPAAVAIVYGGIVALLIVGGRNHLHRLVHKT